MRCGFGCVESDERCGCGDACSIWGRAHRHAVSCGALRCHQSSTALLSSLLLCSAPRLGRSHSSDTQEDRGRGRHKAGTRETEARRGLARRTAARTAHDGCGGLARLIDERSQTW